MPGSNRRESNAGALEQLAEALREAIAEPRLANAKRVRHVTVFCPAAGCPLSRGELAWRVLETWDHLVHDHGWDRARAGRWLERQYDCPVCLGTGYYPWGRVQAAPLGECVNCDGTGHAVDGEFRFQPKTRRSYWRRHFRADPGYRHAWKLHAIAEGVLPVEPY
nr:hypothetical protein [Tepidiforma sp.]